MYTIPRDDDSAEEAQKKTLNRRFIYALALLRIYDAGALAACWGALAGGPPLSSDEVTKRLHDLRRQQEFLFDRNETRMQSLVRDAIRKYLRREMDPERGSLERDAVRLIHKTALAYFEKNIAEQETDLPLSERAENSEWRSSCLSFLHHQLWLDANAALRLVGTRLLEAGNARGDSFLETLEEAALFPTQNAEFLDTLKAGVQSLRKDEPELPPILGMWDAVAGRLPKWNRPPVYRALLALHRGRVLSAALRPADGAKEIDIGLQSLPEGAEPELRERLLQGLAATAAVLVFENRDYEKSLSVARHVLELEPESKVAQSVSVMSLMGLRDYVQAQAVLDDLIKRYPDSQEYRWNQASLYFMKGDLAAFQRELQEMAQAWPDFIKQTMTKLAPRLADSQFRENLTKWGTDAGWDRSQAEAFEQLSSQVTPEVFAQLTEAYMQLLVTPQPTPEKVLEVRELYAKYLPDRADVQAEVGISYVALGRLDEGVAAFQRAVELAPDDPRILSIPPLALSLQGYPQEAIPFLKRAQQKMPTTPGPALMLMESLMATGQAEEARRLGEQSLSAMPADASIRFEYGAILQTLGDHEAGWRNQREAFLASPQILDQMKTGLLQGGPRLFAGFLEKVKNNMGEVGVLLAELPPQDAVRLYSEVVRAELDSSTFGQPSPAILVPVLEELFNLHPGNQPLRFALAQYYELNGNREKAIALLEDLASRPAAEFPPEIHRELSWLYIRAKDLDGALRHLQQIPQPSAQELRILALLLDEAGQIEKALAAYDRAEDLESDQDATNLILFGQQNLFSQRWERAEALLRRALAVQPGSADTHLALAYSLSERGLLEQAKSEIEKALELEPESPVAAARLYRVCQSMAQSDCAEKAREKALHTLSSATLYNQGCILALLGQREEARKRLEQAFLEEPATRELAERDFDLRELSLRAEGAAS